MTGSVTPPTPSSNVPEITLTGYILAAGIGFLLLPLLPFIAVLWLIQKLTTSDEKEFAGDA
jgi:hypothetical protein